ncbi:MAG: HlyD family secretion protein [Nitrospiria bacterium]
MTSRLFFVLFISVGFVVAFAGFPFIEKPVDLGYIERVGVIEATEVHLSSKIAARIASIPFNEGDLVPLGAAVVRLDTEELEAETMQAEADLRLGETDILTAKAEFEKAEAALADTKRDLDRISKLHDEGLVSTAKLEKSQTEYRLAEAEVKVAQARIDSAEAELHQRRAHLHLFQVRLKEREIYSPISGRVTVKAYERGEMVSPGATIVSLIDPNALWARVDMEEGVVGKIRLDSPVDIRIEGMHESAFAGRVIEIGTAGGFATQRDTRRGKQDIKTFRVKIGISEPDGLLKPGMTVQVRIHDEEVKENVIDRRAAR